MAYNIMNINERYRKIAEVVHKAPHPYIGQIRGLGKQGQKAWLLDYGLIET